MPWNIDFDVLRSADRIDIHTADGLTVAIVTSPATIIERVL